MENIKELLDSEVLKNNTPAFIADDPVQFVHRFSDLCDIEVAAVLVSHISWGRRQVILRSAGRLLDMMQGEPHYWIESQAYEEVPDAQNIHRTFFGRDLKYFCRGLRRIYALYGSLENFARRAHIEVYECPAWDLAHLMNGMFEDANHGGRNSRCLPLNKNNALKRLNMALRWLVRDDGIVDLGVWKVIKPSKLFIPLDVHVGNTARKLGLTARRQDDRRAAVEITERLRQFNPDDPVIYDFALFSLDLD